MYEVEIKVELTEEEKEKLIQSFKERGFLSKGTTPQNDFWIEAKESEYGGYDIKRYRREGDKYIYTEKMWELCDGSPVRREDEHEVSKEEYGSKRREFPEALSIKKDREWFAGNYKDIDISITIDSVKFDHSLNVRYFIEAEISIINKEDFIKTRKFIEDFLKEILDRNEIVEAPGIFKMVFQKL